MSHLVLSRKYRPQRFEDLVGQEHVALTLAQAIRSGRIGHAYLFVGPRGTGKTTTARIFAKALNCAEGPTPTPCGACESCRAVASGNDLDVVEMDAASNNGVDDVRALRESVAYRPARSRFRVWIVDEVHMLSLPAFNAFLKTLEEPPPQAKFLFCTTEAHKLPETFTSRVQRLEFRRIDDARIVERLEALAAREGLAVEEGVCARIAAGALGGLRDAESLLEQLLACARDGRVTRADLDAVQGRAPEARVRALFDAVLAGDAAAALEAAGACLAEGGKPDVVLDQWTEELRSLLVVAARDASGREPSGDAHAGRARAFGLPRLARSIDLLLEKRRHLREGADARLVAEVAAVELARLPSARDLDALLEALRAGGPAPAGGPPGRASAPPQGRSAAPRPSPPIAAPSAPAPPAAASPGCAAGGPAGAAPSAEEVVARWPDLLKAASRSRCLAAGLAKARPTQVVGDSIVVVLEGEGVARGMLRDREAAEAFREAARETFGAPLRLVLAETGRASPLGAPTAVSAPLPAPAARPAGAADDPRAHPEVKAVIDAFGARLLAVDRVEPAGPPEVPS